MWVYTYWGVPVCDNIVSTTKIDHHRRKIDLALVLGLCKCRMYNDSALALNM